MNVSRHASDLARQRILRLCNGGLGSRTFQQEVMTTLRRAIPADAWCIGTIDPATLMLTGSIGEGYPMKGSGRFLEIEYAEPSVNTYAELARRTPPVGRLVEATGGDVETSVYWRDICQPAGLRDELRAALVIHGACWGALSFARTARSPDFSEDEADFLAGLAAPLAMGLRAALLIANQPLNDAGFGPGLIILDEDMEPAAISPAGERLLSELRETESPWMGPLPNCVYAVVTRLRQLETLEEILPDLMPRARVHLANGQWLSVQATRLSTTSGSQQVAVIVEPAGPTEIAPLIVSAYSLTNRERDIVGRALQGLSTKEIAADLFISPGTVQQHLKTIFYKVGVRSRRELVSTIFDQQYLSRLKEGKRPGPDGWFAAEVPASQAASPTTLRP